jgi:hypothetical protein
VGKRNAKLILWLREGKNEGSAELTLVCKGRYLNARDTPFRDRLFTVAITRAGLEAISNGGIEVEQVKGGQGDYTALALRLLESLRENGAQVAGQVLDGLEQWEAQTWRTPGEAMEQMTHSVDPPSMNGG